MKSILLKAVKAHDALKVRCNYCGAVAGEKCKRLSGIPAHNYHSARVDEANSADLSAWMRGIND